MILVSISVLSYMLYAFIAEQVNPFRKPKNVFARRRRRLGIACGLALMVSGLIANLTSAGETPRLILITLFLAVLFASPYIAEYIKSQHRR